jgi:hypothetical protein
MEERVGGKSLQEQGSARGPTHQRVLYLIDFTGEGYRSRSEEKLTRF